MSTSFKHVLIALSNYPDVHGALPSAATVDSDGKSISSWRFVLTPYIEKPFALTEWDAPWTDPRNAHYARLRYPLYCFDEAVSEEKPFETNILAITGKDTAFEDGKRRTIEELPNDLILIVECRDSGFHWMEPGDLPVSDVSKALSKKTGRRIEGVCGGGFHVGFADQQVWRLSENTPPDALEKFLTIESAKQHDRQAVLGRYRVN